MVKIGRSLERELDGGVSHLAGEGFGGAGGIDAGARTAIVASYTVAETLGGTMKCSASSLANNRVSKGT